MNVKRSKRKAAVTKQAPHYSARAARGAAPPDSEIDTSDIPPLSDDFFRNAVRNPFYRPVKQSTTVRIDADVLAWLKAQGPGYQTRINAVLRDAMERSVKVKKG
jgi:uncharacterized protein (DUF4415 family)